MRRGPSDKGEDGPLECEGVRDGWRKRESYTGEKEVLMSEGLSCCNSADLPLRVVDDCFAFVAPATHKTIVFQKLLKRHFYS